MLEHIDLRPFGVIQSVGTDFLASCSSLVSIDMHPLPTTIPTLTPPPTTAPTLPTIFPPEAAAAGATTTTLTPTTAEKDDDNDNYIAPQTAYNGYRYNVLSLEFECVFYSQRAFNKCSSLVAGILPPLPLSTPGDITITTMMSAVPTITSVGAGGGAPLSIPVGLLNACPQLTVDTVELDVFCGAKHVSTNFLVSCTGLTTLDLAPLRHVTSIGSAFLFNCTSLLYIDLAPFSNVVSIGPFFLHSCRKLRSIDLSPLSGIERLSTEFMAQCISLTAIDLTPLANNLTQIDVGVFGGCTKLRNVNLSPSPLPKLKRIDRLFLRGCSSLVDLDISPIANVTIIRKQFLVRCPCLHTIDRKVLANVPSYPNFFGHIHTSPMPLVSQRGTRTSQQ